MGKNTRFVGMDVHAETIVVAVADGRRKAESWGTIRNRPEALRKLVRKLGKPSDLRVCYEAGPTGYALYWELAALGVACDVIAPALIPMTAGERIKTDRRDALKLAHAYRNGDLTPVWVPSHEHEALRDLVRAREAAKEDERRARHRLGKYLLRNGLREPDGVRRWSVKWWQWVRALELPLECQKVVLLDYILEVDRQMERVGRLEKAIDEAVLVAPPELRMLVDALQAMRGVAKLTAVTVATEIGTFARFEKASQAMSYAGIVPSERSSGRRQRRGGITRTGNAHLRRVLVEAAFHYRHRPRVGPVQKKRQESLPPKVVDIAWRAQERLHRRYRRLNDKTKPAGKVITALARELIGFMWAIGVEVEANRAAA